MEAVLKSKGKWLNKQEAIFASFWKGNTSSRITFAVFLVVISKDILVDDFEIIPTRRPLNRELSWFFYSACCAYRGGFGSPTNSRSMDKGKENRNKHGKC
jgi:hypothetical protein